MDLYNFIVSKNIKSIKTRSVFITLNNMLKLDVTSEYLNSLLARFLYNQVYDSLFKSIKYFNSFRRKTFIYYYGNGNCIDSNFYNNSKLIKYMCIKDSEHILERSVIKFKLYNTRFITDFYSAELLFSLSLKHFIFYDEFSYIPNKYLNDIISLLLKIDIIKKSELLDDVYELKTDTSHSRLININIIKDGNDRIISIF